MSRIGAVNRACARRAAAAHAAIALATLAVLTAAVGSVDASPSSRQHAANGDRNPVLQPNRARVQKRQAAHKTYLVTPLGESFADRRLRKRGLVKREVFVATIGGASDAAATPNPDGRINPLRQEIERDLTGRQMFRSYKTRPDGGTEETIEAMHGFGTYLDHAGNRQSKVFVAYTRTNVVYPDAAADFSEHHFEIYDIKGHQKFEIKIDRTGQGLTRGEPNALMQELLPEMTRVAGPFAQGVRAIFGQSGASP